MYFFQEQQRGNDSIKAYHIQIAIIYNQKYEKARIHSVEETCSRNFWKFRVRISIFHKFA